MEPKIIKTEAEYRTALTQLEILFDAPIGSPESDLADVLALLIEDYENKHYFIDAPDPMEAIKIRMEELNLKQIDIANEMGGANRVSEILNRKRKLTIQLIRKLSTRLNLSVNILIKDYRLA